MEKLKVSVIGTGHLGSIHVKLWNDQENAELVGIFDPNREQAAKISELNSCKSFSSLEECIQNSDAVTIASPTSLHFEIAKKCLESGVHCFIEKPITQTYQEAEELISLANEKNLIIQVGHVERFNPALLPLREIKTDPLFIEAHRLAQFKPRATDVSVVHDLMIHDIDIVLWLVNSEVDKIDANGVSVLTNTTDIANARISFKNGAVANLTASRISANPMRKMRMFQNNAYVSIDFGKPETEIYRLLDDNEEFGTTMVPAAMIGLIDEALKNKKIAFQKPEIPKVNAIADEQSSFTDSIINNKPVLVTAKEAAEALKVAEEIFKMIS